MTSTSSEEYVALLGKTRAVFRGAAGLWAVAAISASLAAQRDTGPRISAADMEAHVRVLASDEMLGRGFGTVQSMQAALYIAGVMERAGLQPAGDDGGFLQATDVRLVSFDSVPELSALDDAGLSVDAIFGVDFDYYGGGSLDATLDVVVVSEEQDLPATPRSDAALIVAGSRRTWMGWLDEAGAPGGRGWGLILIAGRDSRRGPRSEPPQGMETIGKPPRLVLRGAFRDQLLAGEVTRVRVRMTSKAGTSPAVNVVGILPGVGTPDDPSLADQAIVITAHYDHIGVDEPPEPKSDTQAGDEDDFPDLIYNGADDDASGVAAVLELAEAFADGEPPARTLVFLVVTGEESGLIGTWHYLDHPVVPLERTIVNVNFEMIGRPDELSGGHGRFWLTGYERSNLGPAWAQAGLSISPDKRPDQHFFERSDNIAFVRRGIVGQTLSSYNLHEDYHQVSDEADTLDYRHMETGVRISFAAVAMLADGRLMPAWTTEAEQKESDGSR